MTSWPRASSAWPTTSAAGETAAGRALGRCPHPGRARRSHGGGYRPARWDRGPGILVDDRRAHAEVRRLGRRLRRKEPLRSSGRRRRRSPSGTRSSGRLVGVLTPRGRLTPTNAANELVAEGRHNSRRSWSSPPATRRRASTEACLRALAESERSRGAASRRSSCSTAAATARLRVVAFRLAQPSSKLA